MSPTGASKPTNVPNSPNGRVTVDIDGLRARSGGELGCSRWHDLTQERVQAFADATGDHQWIHVDPLRAASGPFGATVAHGYLTLALIPALLDEVLSVQPVSMVVNYGLNRVRFPAPAPVGSRVRGRFGCQRVADVADGVQACLLATVERQGQSRPVCVAEFLFNYYA